MVFMAKEKDQSRLLSEKGHAMARYLLSENLDLATALIDLQRDAWETKNLKLAKKLTTILQQLQPTNDVLNNWLKNNLDEIIALIEAGEK